MDFSMLVGEGKSVKGTLAVERCDCICALEDLPCVREWDLADQLLIYAFPFVGIY